jgi:hypothetical protein
MGINRREFTKNSLLFVWSGSRLIAKTSSLGGQATGSNKKNQLLKGFIVSDSHFGWKNQQQPSVELQIKMMRQIQERFPDLDVFCDTGDAHHSGLNDKEGDLARGDWTDVIAGGCGASPLYYIAGNHEIIAQTGNDSEWRCNQLGSVSCRPYYSFDIKGIHFVSLPELESPVFINKESLEWLALDLEINKDSTVILLSHNSIKGTTTLLGERGYRGLVNSRELLDLFEHYPNIIAWMHGHNHTYEVVEQDRKLFVSNGRIGGFIPPVDWGHVGQGHLGGIYFEIRPDRLIVKSYSATKDKFLDELGDTHLSRVLMTKTTVDTDALPAYSYGMGGMCDGQKMPVFHHHTSHKVSSELFVAGIGQLAINDDPSFSYYEFRDAGKLGKQWMLMGAQVGYPAYFTMDNKLWEWGDPGIRLLPQESPEETVDVSIPESIFGKNIYYRCAPGRKYKAELLIDSPLGGQTLQLLFICHDKEGYELVNIEGDIITLQQDRHTYKMEVNIPDLLHHKTIYTNASSDNMIQVMVKARFSQLKSKIVLLNFGFMFAEAGTDTVDPAILIDGSRYAHTGIVAPREVVKFDIPGPSLQRSVYACESKGNRRATWLVRQKSLDWQIRNAPVADGGEYLELGPLRNTWTHRKEIVIVPMVSTDKPYVHRLQNIQKARIYPLNRGNAILKIEIIECSGLGKIIVHSENKPVDVIGSTEWKYNNPELSIEAKQGSVIEVK